MQKKKIKIYLTINWGNISSFFFSVLYLLPSSFLQYATKAKEQRSGKEEDDYCYYCNSSSTQWSSWIPWCWHITSVSRFEKAINPKIPLNATRLSDLLDRVDSVSATQVALQTSLATLAISVNGHQTQIAAVLSTIVETQASLEEQNIHIDSVLRNILEPLQQNASNPRQQQGIVFSMPNEQNTSDLIKQPEAVTNESHLKKFFEDHISKDTEKRDSFVKSVHKACLAAISIYKADNPKNRKRTWTSLSSETKRDMILNAISVLEANNPDSQTVIQRCQDYWVCSSLVQQKWSSASSYERSKKRYV